MNRNRLLVIRFLALVMGAFLSFLAYRNLQGGRGRAASGEDVFVATADLQVGAKIESKDIRYDHFDSRDVPAGVFHRRDKLIGRVVIQPIYRGEWILSSKLAGENSGYGLPSLIPPGMRAVSVRVNDTSSISGFVLPGTRVDVLLTSEPAGSKQTTIVLENVMVLANGYKLEHDPRGGEPISASVITLLVSPDDAQKLTLASNQGRIQLALRNPLDTRQPHRPRDWLPGDYYDPPSHACDEAASYAQLLPVGRQANLCLISVHPLPVSEKISSL
jgi:pilus assembly protein CpaB